MKTKSLTLLFGMIFLIGIASAVTWTTPSDVFNNFDWGSAGSATTYGGIDFTFGDTDHTIAYIKPSTSSVYNTTLLFGVSSSSGIADILALDGANGRVGIGTTAPAYKLEINSADNALNVSGNLYVNSTNVGIGTASPQAPLHVNSTSNETVLRLQDVDGVCLHNPESGSESVACSSDEKLKENIREAESVLENLSNIEVKDYVVKASGKETTGVIAQEVQKTNPELVHEENGELFVEQPNPWKLLKAIQELKEKVDSLIDGNYSIKQEYSSDKDVVGTATILVGETEVMVKFENSSVSVPIVTITSVGLPNFFYGVDEITSEGFKILISKPQEKEVVFNWHAFIQKVGEANTTILATSNETLKLNENNGTPESNANLNESLETSVNQTEQTLNANETVSEETSETANETNESSEQIPEVESNESLETPEENSTISEETSETANETVSEEKQIQKPVNFSEQASKKPIETEQEVQGQKPSLEESIDINSIAGSVIKNFLGEISNFFITVVGNVVKGPLSDSDNFNTANNTQICLEHPDAEICR